MNVYIDNLKETKSIYAEYLGTQNRIVKNQTIIIPELEKKIVPGKYMNLNEELDKYYKLRKVLYQEYQILKDKIIYGDSLYYKKKFEDLLEEIGFVQERINGLCEYYDSLPDNKMLPSNKKLNSYYEKMNEDENYMKIYIKEYINYENSIKEFIPESEISYVILEKPNILSYKEKIELKESKIKESKIKPSKLSEENSKIIKQKIKSMLKPKNVEECASLKRSQAYFMKKEELLNFIEENPLLKQIMPSNYKSLNKEEICKILFKK